MTFQRVVGATLLHYRPLLIILIAFFFETFETLYGNIGIAIKKNHFFCVPGGNLMLVYAQANKTTYFPAVGELPSCLSAEVDVDHQAVKPILFCNYSSWVMVDRT